jgi:hypothetical protein
MPVPARWFDHHPRVPRRLKHFASQRQSLRGFLAGGSSDIAAA